MKIQAFIVASDAMEICVLHAKLYVGMFKTKAIMINTNNILAMCSFNLNPYSFPHFLFKAFTYLLNIVSDFL